MSANPAFAITPRIGAVAITTADSSYTAPAAFGSLITGATTGTRISEIVVKCAATSAAAIVRVFIYDGSLYYLFDEITVSAAVGSSTVQQYRLATTYMNLILPSSSYSIRVTTSVSQLTHVIALAADL